MQNAIISMMETNKKNRRDIKPGLLNKYGLSFSKNYKKNKLKNKIYLSEIKK